MKTALFALVALATSAHAAPDRWNIGALVTSDSETQQTRLGAGLGLGAWNLGIVVDAQPFADGSDNLDAIVEYRRGTSFWGLLGGWRTCSIQIEHGRQWHQQLLLGATGNLPSLFGGRVQPSFGIELATTIVRHGDSLATDWISLASQRHVEDTLSMNMTLRFDYVSAL